MQSYIIWVKNPGGPSTGWEDLAEIRADLSIVSGIVSALKMQFQKEFKATPKTVSQIANVFRR